MDPMNKLIESLISGMGGAAGKAAFQSLTEKKQNNSTVELTPSDFRDKYESFLKLMDAHAIHSDDLQVRQFISSYILAQLKNHIIGIYTVALFNRRNKVLINVSGPTYKTENISDQLISEIHDRNSLMKYGSWIFEEHQSEDKKGSKTVFKCSVELDHQIIDISVFKDIVSYFAVEQYRLMKKFPGWEN
jgi:hypothetical protein